MRHAAISISPNLYSHKALVDWLKKILTKS